jgi:hypothetical protein
MIDPWFSAQKALGWKWPSPKEVLMSLEIDVGKVEQVLLADGWHKVADHSLALDSYEFVHKGQVLLGGGQVTGIPSTGAEWRELDGSICACPLTAVLAVKWKIRREPGATTKPQGKASSALSR